MCCPQKHNQYCDLYCQLHADSKLLLDTWGCSPQCLPRDILQPDIMNPRPANKSAPPRDAAPVSCDPAKAQRSHPLSGSATAHTQGLPPPAPGSPTCSVNRAALLGFPPTNGGLLTTLFCPLAFPLIIYLGELLVFHSRAQRATSHLPGSRCWHLSRSGVSTSDSGARHPGFKGQLFHTELCDLGQALIISVL